jgi:putative ABC transport system permease protein
MRFYEALLHLYPVSFRGEYGAEMCAIFAQRRRGASGAAAILALWVDVIWEVVFNSIAAHWDVLRQDVRYTARALARTPGFAITAILVAALGIGANTAAFTVTDFVLIRPLPFPQPERLVNLSERLPGYTEMELSPATYRDWKSMSKSFEAMGGYTDIPVNLVGQGDPERIYSALVTADLLPVLGAQPAIGRPFTAADERKGSPGTVLLGYGLWKAQFGGDPGVLGRKVLLDDAAYIVIGVMPPDFHFPSREVEIWTPFQFGVGDFEDRNNNYVYCVARLKSGVSIEQARAEMSVIAARLERQYPKENAKHGATVNRLRDGLSNQSRLLLIALCGAAGCLLLISCANLANLLLARGLVRQKELAVRAALGAGRERLVRQLITESLVLAIPGGVLGVLLAVTAVPLLARLVPNSLPIAQTPSVDWRMLIFAGVLTSLTGVAFGVVPAMRAAGNRDLSGLREGSRAGGGRKERVRSILVIAELVASVVLLVSSGLLMRALWKVQATDPGFRADGVLTLRTALPMPKYEKTAVREAFYTRVLSGVRQLPGVSRAAYISFLPMVMGGGIFPASVNGELLSRDQSQTASMRFVTPGFFSALSIPLHLGRDVSESDTIDTPFVAVVSQSFVRRYWPNENPLGRHFYFATHDRMVVGVVGDVRVRGLERNSEPQVYLPYNQLQDHTFEFYSPKDLVVRSDAPPATLVPSIRRIIQSVDRQQPISNVRTMGDIVETQTASRSIQLRVLGAFAAMALLLAGIGIHGLLSFTVSQRSQEIGVRIAFGACPGDILVMVLRQGARLAAVGVALGAVLAYEAGRAMEGLLAGVTPADAPTFLTVIGLTLAMTLIGSLLPALRATRVDPITAIRME